jgi:DNA-binding LacI/PurR family transcriptional regulator
LGLGHERIAYIGGSRSVEESLERRLGYEQALAGRGITLDRSLVIESDGWPEGGSLSMERLLRLPRLPTAIFCFNDMTAIGAIKAACAAGLRVPRDLSIVGFDDISLARYLVPALTTVAQQKDLMARLAVELILSLLDSREPPANTTLPAKLVVRDSTAPPGHQS